MSGSYASHQLGEVPVLHRGSAPSPPPEDKGHGLLRR